MRRTTIGTAVVGLLLAASAGRAAAQVSGADAPADTLREALSAFRLTQEGVEINGRFVRGGTRVEVGDTVTGPVVTFGGTAEVSGYVTGNVYALWGDVIVREGAEIRGSANAYRGRVIIDGGHVRGDLHAWTAAAPAADAATKAPLTTGGALKLTGGWTAMLVAIALLVLVLASKNLEAAARVLEQDFGRALFVGVIGQLGFIPALLLTVVALAVTIIGVLLVPFALVAAPIALAGLVTLGWLALALVTGRALSRSGGDAASRGDALRALLMGVLILMLPWGIAAAVHGAGALALVARIVAFSVTWVAATAGLGATLLSRGGTERTRRETPAAAPLQGWQTPTPIGGVAAARRPIPARPGATPK
jgi:hypothetical protein